MTKQYFYKDKQGKMQRFIFCIRGCPESYRKEDLGIDIFKATDHAHMCKKCCLELGLKRNKTEDLLVHSEPSSAKRGPDPVELPVTDPLFYAYVIKCNDGSYYAGITSDIENCVHAHNTNKSSKFTRPKEKKPVILIDSKKAWSMEEAKKVKLEIEKKYKS